MPSPEKPTRLQRARGVGALAFLFLGLAAIAITVSATLLWAVYSGVALILT